MHARKEKDRDFQQAYESAQSKLRTVTEISEDLFERAQRLARKEKTSFRALTEAGLRLVIAGKHHPRSKTLPPLVTFGTDGTTKEFEDWNWGQFRDAIYKGHGA